VCDQSYEKHTCPHIQAQIFVPAAWDSLPALGCTPYHAIFIQKLILLLCIKQLGVQLHTIKFKMHLRPLWRLAEHVRIARFVPTTPVQLWIQLGFCFVFCFLICPKTMERSTLGQKEAVVHEGWQCDRHLLPYFFFLLTIECHLNTFIKGFSC